MTTVVASLSSAGASQASLLLNKPSSIAGPALLASYAVFRHIKDRCKKNSKAHSSRLSSTLITCQSNLPALPKLSISATADGPCSRLSTCASKEKISQHLSSASSSHAGEQVLGGIPALSGRRRSLRPPSAYFKSEHFSFKYPVLSEKPKWWMRALATLPYLVALQISYAGYLFQPLVQRHEAFGPLSFWVPGAITRLPTWFVMVYSYCVYIWIVKNKDWPHFLRFHFVMGMLLEILLQVFWTASNFFPVIQYEGMLGMYYWAVVGAAFIFLTLLCVGHALLGDYARIPIVGDAAFIHTLFFMGGSSR